MIFPCPKCNTQIEVKEQQTKEIHFGVFCPSCKQLLKVYFQIEPLELYDMKSDKIQIPINLETSVKNQNDIEPSGSFLSSKTEEKELIKAPKLKDMVIKWVTEKDVQLPLLPDIRQKALDFFGSPEINESDLIKLVQTDQVLTATIIRLANSFSPANLAKIDTLSEAVNLLGVKRIHKAILHVIHSPVNNTSKLVKNGLLKKLWVHNLACAIGSRWLAKRLNFQDHEKIFILGLIHNIGNTIILQILSDLKNQNPDLQLPKKEVMNLVEEFHSEIGADMLESWNFPPKYVAIVRNQNLRSADSIIQILQVTDFLCVKLGLAFTPKNEIDFKKLLSTISLKIDDIILAQMEVELENFLMRMTRLL